MTDVLARLRALQAHDVPVTGGRTLAYVYDSGLEEADEVGRAAVAAFAGSNGLDPTAFPSLLTMENELLRERARREPEATFRLITRFHWIMLALSVLTVAGAVAGSHGFLLFS